MKILFLTGRETSYPRNALLLKIFRSLANVEVFPIQDKSNKILNRSIDITFHIWSRKDLSSFDLIFAGFYGHLLMLSFPMRDLPPILFDAFLSTYDTLIEDRHLAGKRSLLAAISKWVDRTAVSRASHVLLDTNSNISFYKSLAPTYPGLYSRIFASCDPEIFFPRPYTKVDEGLVLFYGTYLPLHGIETIIKAAFILKNDKQVHFKIIGSGQTSKKIYQLVSEYHLENVELLPPIPLTMLPEEIAKASICLGGHFGESQKASRVIAAKTFQCLAMGKPTIVGDNQANRELLTPDHDAIFCQMGSPEALAESIQKYLSDQELRRDIGLNGLRTFKNTADFPILQNELNQIIQSLVD